MKKSVSKLTHLDASRQPTMVDIGSKKVTRRTAEAAAEVFVTPKIAALFRDGDIHAAKGPVFQTAIIAGTQAVKDTSRIIPFCHPLPLDKCKFSIALKKQTVFIRCVVSAKYRTGVEMEALTGASVAALTIYDMCKAISHKMEIRSIRLISKTGGKTSVG